MVQIQLRGRGSDEIQLDILQIKGLGENKEVEGMPLFG